VMPHAAWMSRFERILLEKGKSPSQPILQILINVAGIDVETELQRTPYPETRQSASPTALRLVEAQSPCSTNDSNKSTPLEPASPSPWVFPTHMKQLGNKKNPGKDGREQREALKERKERLCRKATQQLNQQLRNIGYTKDGESLVAGNTGSCSNGPMQGVSRKGTPGPSVPGSHNSEQLGALFIYSWVLQTAHSLQKPWTMRNQYTRKSDAGLQNASVLM
jgi:hypothetical protein